MSASASLASAPSPKSLRSWPTASRGRGPLVTDDTPLESDVLDVEASLEAADDALYERGATDGLPIVPAHRGAGCAP